MGTWDRAELQRAMVRFQQLSAPVERALQQLTADQRAVVLLADVDEHSYQEIADIMAISIGTVRSRLHRARGQLRKLILRQREQEQREGQGA